MSVFRARTVKQSSGSNLLEVAQHTGLSRREISEAHRLVQEHENDIRSAWHRHFPG
jgi:hypothetical protein